MRNHLHPTNKLVDMYITAVWGNAQIATIRVSKAQCKLILEGKTYEADWSYYYDGNECINAAPICVLTVNEENRRAQ
jgi:hypothetical protein